MAEAGNIVTTRATGVDPGMVFSFSCEPIEGNRAVEDEYCCGEKLQTVVLEGGRRIAKCRHCQRQVFEQGQIHDARSPWIGVDLDGTLATDTGRQLWNSDGRPKIGQPVIEMVARIKGWVADGCTVKVFTARASSPAQVAGIRAWLAGCGLPDLEITNVKDLNMVELWDDRCVQVAPNTGRPLNPPQRRRVQAPAFRSTGASRRRGRSGLLFSLKQIFLTL